MSPSERGNKVGILTDVPASSHRLPSWRRRYTGNTYKSEIKHDIGSAWISTLCIDRSGKHMWRPSMESLLYTIYLLVST